MSPKRTGMHFLFCFVDLALIAPNIRWIRRFSAAAQHLIMVHFNLSPLKPFVPKYETKSFKRLKLLEDTVGLIDLTIRFDWLDRISCFNQPVL